ncbi:MAG: hypothetical protein GX620_03680 [Chloroflexi bacterium]|nr:hypothetical protein [Chloroflexota bacterium]
MQSLRAGAAAVNISPHDSQFLFGYPHVERYSTGIHDPLFSSCLYLSDSTTDLMFIANDIIFVGKDSAQRARARIEQETGVRSEHIMITATHTHSGPITVDYLSNADDPIVPKRDPAYVRLLEDGIVSAATAAFDGVRPAEIGLAVADGTGIGTNRRDPTGPADPQVPVLMVRDTAARNPIACMVAYSMHPTVLHEDSTLVSADFPGFTRRYIQQQLLGQDCPVLYHTGPAGNQSPRHVTHSNTFEEAERLGVMLGERIGAVLPSLKYSSHMSLRTARRLVDLPRKTFPTVEEAERTLAHTRQRLESLRSAGAARQDVRTAEVDWFGAEETLTLARAALDGRVDTQYQACLPAEIQVLGVGDWMFVGWPGEIFVEYALKVKTRFDHAFIVSMANGELQGYIVTEEAAAEGGYEASNGLFPPASGHVLIETTMELLQSLAR